MQLTGSGTVPFHVLNHSYQLICTDEQREGPSFYGAAALIVRGHSQAKQRVILFLTTFIICGFCSELVVRNNQ